MADKKPAAKAAPKTAAPSEPKEQKTAAAVQRKPATGLRVAAVVLWLFAIGFEVLAILTLNGNWESFQNFLAATFTDLMVPLIIEIVADLVLVVVGAQLWKKANHQDPVSEKNKVKFVLWNNMGVIAAVIAFLPLIILLLKNKDLDAKTKKIVSAVAIVAIVIAGLLSYDFNPVSLEDMQQEVSASGSYTGEIYWTRYGKSYHLDPDCQALSRTLPENLYQGTLEEAFEAGRTDPCDFCALSKVANEAA
ncbi:MAG: hypothetical protein VB092_01005 [Oscillospiraceae bacterium]|nr:hypothetical protein [Oscillospiraceae bacterium]